MYTAIRYDQTQRGNSLFFSAIYLLNQAHSFHRFSAAGYIIHRFSAAGNIFPQIFRSRLLLSCRSITAQSVKTDRTMVEDALSCYTKKVLVPQTTAPENEFKNASAFLPRRARCVSTFRCARLRSAGGILRRGIGHLLRILGFPYL